MGKANIQEFEQCERKGKKAGIYIRVSHDDMKRVKASDVDQVVKQSILTQEDNGRKTATENNWTYEIYKDINLSGTTDQDNRLDLNRLCNDMENGLIHTENPKFKI